VLLRSEIWVAMRLPGQRQREIQCTNRQASHIPQKGDRMDVSPLSSCPACVFGTGTKGAKTAASSDTSSVSGDLERGYMCGCAVAFSLYHAGHAGVKVEIMGIDFWKVYNVCGTEGTLIPARDGGA
jgi:hypothetical protein